MRSQETHAAAQGSRSSEIATRGALIHVYLSAAAVTAS
jgi:hypothetical protein